MTARHWAAAGWLFLGSMAQAADITPAGDSALGCTLEASGRIEAGDVSALDTLGQDGGRLCLDSDGGDLAAAVALAEAVVRLGIGTGVAEGARCLGSCGLVFLAGVSQGAADRLLHPDGRLEIGLPALPENEAPAEAHEDALQALGRYLQLRRADVALPDSIFTGLLATSPGQYLPVRSVGQTARWRISVAEVAAPTGNVAQALSHACGTVSASLQDLRPEDVTQAGRLRDFGYADFGPDGAVGRDGDCTAALVLDAGTLGGRVETAAGTLPLTPALLYPAQTRLDSLPRVSGGEAEAFLARLSQDARLALASVDFESCWLLSPFARVVNVEEYVNLRAAPGFGAEILRRAPLGEQLSIIGSQSLLTPGDADQARRCLDACNALALSPDDPQLRGEAGGCIRSNVFWYEVRDADRSGGFVSRKFLAP